MCTCMYAWMYVYTCLRACVRFCVYIYIHAYILQCTFKSINIHVCTFILKNIYSHIHV